MWDKNRIKFLVDLIYYVKNFIKDSKKEVEIMNIRRFLILIDVVMVFLIGWGCKLKGSGASGVPGFIKVGKIYKDSSLQEIEVLEIGQEGWIKVKDVGSGEIMWYNLNQVDWIVPLEK